MVSRGLLRFLYSFWRLGIKPESVNHLGEIFSENLKILCLWRYVFLQCFHPIVKKYLESYNPKTLAVIRFLAHFHLLGSRIQDIIQEQDEDYECSTGK